MLKGIKLIQYLEIILNFGICPKLCFETMIKKPYADY